MFPFFSIVGMRRDGQAQPQVAAGAGDQGCGENTGLGNQQLFFLISESQCGDKN